MQHFFSIDNITDAESMAREALRIKYDPHADPDLGKGRSICLIFMNSSLRTRLSTVRAAENLGLKVSVFNAGDEGWKLEFEDGTVMDQEKAEHVKDAAKVIGSYFDIIGIRSFPGLEDRNEDENEKVLRAFMKYSERPVINMESCTVHPLQSFADLVTIREHSPKKRPKVVLTWAPHPRALPRAVPNSFAEWMNAAEVDLTITHPYGLELDKKYSRHARIIHDQREAFKGADFIYAKNWSSLDPYGSIVEDPDWTIDRAKMELTDEGKFMHCLPIRRNVVATDEVIDHESSLIYEQAENRTWAAQTVIKKLLSM